MKAYFALKMVGQDIDAPHMERARRHSCPGWRRQEQRVPHAAIMPIAHFAELWTRITGGTEPFVTVDGVKMARKKMHFSSDKAMRDLGYRARPAHEAFVDAVAWFRENGYLF